MATFVLIHGAWLGGWVWSRVAADLRARGHQLFTPTLTGLGERRHLLRPDVGLETHLDDVRLLLDYEGARRPVIVGHGYGAVVARLILAGSRDISRIALFDPWPVKPGQPLAASLDPEAIGGLALGSAMLDGTPVIDPPASALVAGLSRQDADWVEERLVPFPVAALHYKLPETLAPPGVPRFEIFTSTRQSFRAGEGSTGHNANAVEINAPYLAMIAKPDAVSELLDNFVRQPAGQFST